MPPLCVATSRANCTEYWAPSSPVCRVNEGRARGCMGGADGALWARIALCGWRGSASFGHPPRHRPRKGGVGGPEIVINRRAEPSRCMCVWLSVEGDDSDARGVLARSSTDCGERSGLFCESGAAADGREPRSSRCPFSVRSGRRRASRAGGRTAVAFGTNNRIIEYMFASYIDGKEAIYP